MSLFPSLNEQMDLIVKGVEEILPENDLVKKIEKSISSKTPLNIKCGCDPSRPDLHIGHSVVLRKLRDFQDLGHKASLLIGNFTAMIGDPTGRNKTRPQLTIKEATENAKSYVNQASLILNPKTLNILYNGDWLSKMNFTDIINLTSKYTVARMLERDDFTKRYASGTPISIHEFLYPLAQGYDSVHMKTDVELGGTDQKFNLLVGRALQKESGLDAQIIITTPLIEGTDGIEKMSKSYNNYIAFTDSPSEIYGKTLSIPDELITKYFKFCTSINSNKIDQDLANNLVKPRDMKRFLARELVTIYHNSDLATKAETEFDSLFITKDNPDTMTEIKIDLKMKLIDIMVLNNMVSSNTEAKRMIKQGAVKIDNQKIIDIQTEISPNNNVIVKVGKRKFLKIN
jgi:tyrosyl-tRNA synthetase